MIFTKADKQSGIKTDQNVARFKKALGETFEEIPEYFITSSETQLGHDDILTFIENINKVFEIPQLN